MHTLSKGILIAVEGIDGSGKSLLSKNLTEALATKNFDVLLTKEPGGTELGQQLRKILQEQTVSVNKKAEFLLFASDRAQHFEQLVIPNLQKNKIIISDRMADSSIAYQGYGRNLDIEMIKIINTWAMNNIKPDLTLYVKIDPKIAFERIAQRKMELTAFEREHTDFMQKVTNGFEQLYQNRSDVIKLDGTKKPDEIIQEALEKILNWLKENKILL